MKVSDSQKVLGIQHGAEDVTLAENCRDSIHYLGSGNYFGEAIENERNTIITQICLPFSLPTKMVLLQFVGFYGARENQCSKGPIAS